MYLGIDLGTSEPKALLLERRQRVVGRAAEAMQVRHARFRALYPAVAGGRQEEASP